MAGPPRSPRTEATADLFRILKAMDCDPEVREADFRIAYRIAQAVNANTDWAIIGDDCLADEVPRCDHAKLRRFRRRMEQLGWIETVAGRRGQATEYRFRDERVDAIANRLEAARDRREEAHHMRQLQSRAKRQMRGLGGDPTSHDECRLGGEIDLIEGALSPPLLPQTPTSQEISTATVEDMALSAHDPETGEIPPPMAREGCPACDECGRPAVIRCEVLQAAFCGKHRWHATRETAIRPLDYRAASRGA